MDVTDHTDLIAEYRSHLTNLARAPRTITDYTDILRRADRQLPHGLAGATIDELRGWIFTDKRGAASRLLYRTVIAGFFTWACCPPDDPDAPWLDYDPARHLPHVRRPRRKPKPVSTEQLTDVLARAPEPHRAWFLLAAYAGLRCVEISRANREHITEAHVWVPSGKGDRERYVPTHPALWRVVAELPGDQAQPAEGRAPGQLPASQDAGRREHAQAQALVRDADVRPDEGLADRAGPARTRRRVHYSGVRRSRRRAAKRGGLGSARLDVKHEKEAPGSVRMSPAPLSVRFSGSGVPPLPGAIACSRYRLR
jgi:integrase